MSTSGKVIKVSLGIPNKGITDATAYDNHLELLHHLGKLAVLSSQGIHEYNGEKFTYPDGVEFRFFLSTIPRVFPALARERIVEHAVEMGHDYVFMFDDDMLLPPDTFERLFSRQVNVVAPLAFTRLRPFRPVIYNLTSGWDSVDKQDYYMNKAVLSYPKDQLVQCDAVGFGAVLIKLSVLEKMKKPWFMTTSGAGEDIHWCYSAQKSGVRIFCDTSIKLGHLGENFISNEESYEAYENIEELRKVFGTERKYPQ